MDSGAFPFGRPNSARPPRLAKPCTVFVVGVYPSAFHISWWPPPHLDPRPEATRRHPFIAALAVDVEPTVFWDGKDPDPGKLLREWIRAVGFTEAYGRALPSGSNGPSGAGLIERYLTPLGTDPAAVSFTDVMPTFFVKDGPKSQGDAITTRFAPIARKLGLHIGSLPARPSPTKLVELAVGTQSERLRAELRDAGAPLVITLGQEAATVLRRVVDRAEGTQTRLASDDAYGRAGTIAIDGYVAAWMPLVHPGLLRQSVGAWSVTHQRWEDDRTAERTR